MIQNIELVGHDSPTGKYPAPVVPVGRFDTGKLVAIYIDAADKIICEPVHQEAIFIRHDETMKELLKDFDYRKHFLFGLAPDNLKFYAQGDEAEFFKSLLSDEGFSNNNIFLRLSLAEATKDMVLITKELEPCYRFLKEEAPEMADEWKREKLNEILERAISAVQPFSREDCRAAGFLGWNQTCESF